MAFETSAFEGCSNLVVCLAEWANTVTGGVFWSLILLGIGVVLFMATFNFGINRAFGFGSIGSAFSALFLIQIDLIPNWILNISLIVALIGIASMFMGER